MRNNMEIKLKELSLDNQNLKTSNTKKDKLIKKLKQEIKDIKGERIEINISGKEKYHLIL
jgi:hypothetical protein